MIRMLNIMVPYDRSYTDLLEELRTKHPAGASRSGGFELRLPDDDPSTLDAVRMLDEYGLQPRKQLQKMERGTYYWARPNYEYEPSDLDRADYFSFVAGTAVNSSPGADGAGILVNAKDLRRKFAIAEARSSSGTIVSNATRRRIEEEGLIGADFLPIGVVKGKPSATPKVLSWDEIGVEPFWHISSSVVLPTLHPKCLTLDRGGSPCNGNYEKGCYLMEGEFPAGELNYLRSDIEQCEPFDIALTLEPFGNAPDPYSHKLVVSKRFRKFILKLDPKSFWLPVYVHSN